MANPVEARICLAWGTKCRDWQHRLWLGWIAVLAVGGLIFSWGQGQVPRRSAPATGNEQAQSIAPDLALYCEVIAAVRQGDNYYDVAADAIPRYGFPTSSPLNWRLPTSAWLFSCLPCVGWVQLALVMLSVVAVGLAVLAKYHDDGPLAAFVLGLLLIGIIRWSLDGYAFVAQEPWAATLLILSLAAQGLSQRDARWATVAIACGGLALLFRELALPYCAAACVVAAAGRKWFQAVGFGSCIAVFVVFYAWHVGQVQTQADLAAAATSTTGVGQWLCFGGLDFVLLTTRMNGLLFSLPSGALWGYLLAAMAGLSSRSTPVNTTACLTAVAFLLAFAVVGRSENFYWGLMPAPFLAWGAASAPTLLLARVSNSRTHQASDGPRTGKFLATC